MSLLTPTQERVARLLSQGLTGPQVAQALGVRLCTVRMHIRVAATRLPGPPGIPALTRLRLWYLQQPGVRQN